jgi:hypothetical protein
MDAEGALERDRLARLRVVVEGLAQGDPEREHEQRKGHTDAPARGLLAPSAPAALAALDRGQRRHGV